MKNLILLFIRFYQKFVSPYKGFSCAYRVATKKQSCSAYGYEVINRFGLKKGYALLKRRFVDCKICNEELKSRKKNRFNKPFSINSNGTVIANQKGDIDCGGCDGVDGCDLGCSALEYSNCFVVDIFNCGDCGIEDACPDSCSKDKKISDAEISERKEKVLSQIEKAENLEIPETKVDNESNKVWPKEE